MCLALPRLVMRVCCHHSKSVHRRRRTPDNPDRQLHVCGAEVSGEAQTCIRICKSLNVPSEMVVTWLSEPRATTGLSDEKIGLETSVLNMIDN